MLSSRTSRVPLLKVLVACLRRLPRYLCCRELREIPYEKYWGLSSLPCSLRYLCCRELQEIPYERYWSLSIGSFVCPSLGSCIGCQLIQSRFMCAPSGAIVVVSLLGRCVGLISRFVVRSSSSAPLGYWERACSVSFIKYGTARAVICP